MLLMGVATTADFLQSCLPSHALARLNAQRFDLKTPLERLEAVVKAVLVESFSAFEIGHGVAQFITRFFLQHDLTISSFIRSLKVGSPSLSLSLSSVWVINVNPDVVERGLCVNVTIVNPTRLPP